MRPAFGAPADGGGFHYRQEQDIQALKLRLHRYIIDEIDEDGMNLLEGARGAVVQYVSEKVCEYGSRHQLAISRYELDRLAEELVDELTGFGPLEILLRDPGVSEILVNGPGRVFIEREGRLYQSDLRFIDDHHVLRVIQRILAPLGRRLDESSPMVDARLPDGSRVNAIIPPVALDGPCISIRKFSQELLRSADLLAYQSVDEPCWSSSARPSRGVATSSSAAAPVPARPPCSTSSAVSSTRANGSSPSRTLPNCNSVTTMWCAWKPVRRTPRAMAR